MPKKKTNKEIIRQLTEMPALVIEERNVELENLIGNLFIAQYQTDKLRQAIASKIGGYGVGAAAVNGETKTSAVIYKYNGKYFKIAVAASELPLAWALEIEKVNSGKDEESDITTAGE